MTCTLIWWRIFFFFLSRSEELLNTHPVTNYWLRAKEFNLISVLVLKSVNQRMLYELQCSHDMLSGDLVISVVISYLYLSIYVSIYLIIHTYLLIYQSFYICIYLPSDLPTHLPAKPSIYLSLCLPVSVSVCLFTFSFIYLYLSMYI